MIGHAMNVIDEAPPDVFIGLLLAGSLAFALAFWLAEYFKQRKRDSGRLFRFECKSLFEDVAMRTIAQQDDNGVVRCNLCGWEKPCYSVEVTEHWIVTHLLERHSKVVTARVNTWTGKRVEVP